MNKSEEIVNIICRKTILSFWSFPNPIRKDNLKEFTDILIVCDPFVLLVSVKDVDISESGNNDVDSKRWYSRAIEKSYAQLYGAERVLTQKISKILTFDKRYEIPFPSNETMRIFRIGISIGRRQNFALPFGHFETGFVHFFDQNSFPTILNELNTISDFTEYLSEKERYFDSGKTVYFKREEDLLAIYLHNSRKFPQDLDGNAINPLTWEIFSNRKDVINKKEQEKTSYIWDGIIEEIYNDFTQNKLLVSPPINETERAFRAMAKENRFNRMALSDIFLEFIGFKTKPKARSRFVQSLSGTTYVFLLAKHEDQDRSLRIRELELRCWVVRKLIESSQEIVGIATNPYMAGQGHAYDLCYLYLPQLDDSQKKMITKMQEKLGFFSTNAHKFIKHYDEYPTGNNLVI